ncbi:MAG: MMPL family transporter [Phycisphaerales bacterium]|nr:MAG: MMPL family transporter [Phycisphaerales bacterium]
MKPLVQSVLTKTAQVSWRHPLLMLCAAGVLTGASLFVLARVRPQTDIVNLLPQADPVAQAFLVLTQTQSAMESELVYVTTASGEPAPDRLVAFADRLGERLATSGPVVSVDYRVPEDFERYVRHIYLPNALLYLNDEELAELTAMLTTEAIDRRIARNAATLAGGASTFMKRLIGEDPLSLRSTFTAELKRFRGEYRYDLESRHYLSADGKAILLRVAGRRPAQDIDFAGTLHEEIARLVAEADPEGLTVRYGGAYAIALETSSGIRRDTMVTMTGAVVALLLLFGVVYRRPIRVLFALVPLLLGLVWAFALFVVAKGEITVITAVGGGMLAGLGVDFTIHILSRYETMPSGLSREDRLVSSVRRCGPGIVAAALTTAAGFAMFSLTGFPGIRQLGLLGFIGILTTLIATIGLLPAVVRLAYGPIAGQASRPALVGFGLGRLGRGIQSRPRPWTFAAALVTVGALVLLIQHRTPPFSFEGDFRQMHPSRSQSLSVQAEIFDKFGGSFESAFLVARGCSSAEVVGAFQKVERTLRGLAEEGLLVGYSSPGMFLPDPAGLEGRLEKIRALESDRILADLSASLERHGFDVEHYKEHMDFLRDSLLQPGSVDLGLFASKGLDSLFDRFVYQTAEGCIGVATLSFTEAHWLKSERQRAYARVEEALPSDGPEMVLTGIGPVSVRAESLIARDVKRMVGCLLLAVVVIVFLHFRRATVTLLVLMPVVLTLIWLLAAMKLFGIHLNLVNVVVFPLVIGIGIDDALHLMFRYRAPEGGGVAGMLESTGHAVVMTTLTTAIGFGSMAVCSTPGIRSMGYVAVLGVAGALIASIVVLPAVLRFIDRREP